MGNRAFTLVEALITAVVTVLVVGGVLISLINSMVLNEYNRSFSVAMNIARTQIEQALANRANFSSIVPIPPTVLTRAADGIDGMYAMYVDSVAGGLIDVRVAVCWKDRGQRFVGECREDGSSIVFEDRNGNTRLDSPCVIETSIAQR